MRKASKNKSHAVKNPGKFLRLLVSALSSKKWQRIMRPCARLVYQLAAVALVLLVLAYTVGRLWLPHLAERKTEIEHYLSQRSAYHIQMDALEPYWDGLNPGMRIAGFKVYAPDSGRLAIQLDEVRITLSWLHLLSGKIAINSLVLVQPSITFERLADGRLRVSGLEAPDVSGTTDPDTGFIHWLFQQNELAIEDGELQWVDHVTREAPLHLNLVNMSLRNAGNRHHLEFEAVFPRELCRDCRFVADVQGNPLLGGPWDGEIYLRVRGVDTHNLPGILRERLPAGLAGRLTAQLWSQWSDARPVGLHGRIDAAALALPLYGVRPISLRQVVADVKWSGSTDARRWRLDMENVSLGLTGKPWSAGKLRLERSPGDNLLRARHLNLDDLSAFLATLPDEYAVPLWLRSLKPTGDVDDFVLQLTGDPTAPTAYSLQTGIRGLSLQPYDRIPGVQGLSGRLSLDTTSGEMQLASEASTLDMPRLFPAPVSLRKASGRLSWQRTDTHWQVDGSGLDVVADDGKVTGGFEARIPHDKSESPLLKLRLDFANMNGAHAANYYPVALPEIVRHWLTSAVVSGRVTTGHVIYSGAMRDFPFRAGNGRFEVAAHVTHGVFDYLPGWPGIDNIEADLLFRGAGLTVTASSGRIRGLDVSQVVVSVPDLHPPDGAEVHVVGRVSGPANEALGVLYDSASGKLAEYLPRGLRATGNGVLDLDIQVPVRRPHETHWTGLYRFDQNGLQLPYKDIQVSDIQGEVALDEHGVHSGNIAARMLGEPLLVDISPLPEVDQAAPEVVLNVRSKLSRNGLNQLLGNGLAGYFQGEAPWVFSVRFAGKSTRLAMDMNMQALGASLPPPLDKAVGVPLTLSLRTVAADLDPLLHGLEVHLGSRAGGRLLFQHRASGGWSFLRGRLDIGAEAPLSPEGAGLHLNVRAPALDADRWRSVLRVAAAKQDSAAADIVTRFSGEVDDLRLFGRHFGQFGLDMVKSPQGWVGPLRGANVSGSLLVSTRAGCAGAGCASAGSPHSAVVLTLDQLVIPAPVATDAVANEAVADPTGLPEVHIKSKSLTLDGHALGEFELAALPTADRWKIENLRLTQPLMHVEASGDWGAIARAGQQTRLQVNLSTPNLGAMLGEFGYAQEIAGGEAQFVSNWTWNGSPGEFSLARLDGNTSIAISNGRLVQVKQGAGRLLGVIDARALSRYFSLDFSGLFSKGFTFDSIKGNATVEKGNAYTRELTVKGASADIGISGRVGLAARDLDLDIKVLPRFKGELAMTGLLLGTPVVGVAVLAAQELLKKPLAEGTRLDYTLKGSWSDPQVVRVAKQNPAKADNDN